jgi:transposase
MYLLPALVKTWAPRGQTPILINPLTRDHWSIIGAVTPAGQLLFQMYPHAIKGTQVVCFLRHLLRHIDGRLLVIWDGLPAHHGQQVKDFLKAGGAARLHLQRLPGYAPDLNPQEGIWQYLKRVELGNVCCMNLPELQHEFRKAVARLRHKPTIIPGCFQLAGLDL